MTDLLDETPQDDSQARVNKAVLMLIVLTGAALALAVTFNLEVRRERARADALAERVAALEPVERPSNAALARSSDSAPKVPPPPVDLAVERSEAHASHTVQERSTPPKNSHRGSIHAREQVERLQAALADGTPLQAYQVQALITAIDEVRREIQIEKDARVQAGSTEGMDWNAESNERLVGAAADILFESQLESFIELLDDDSDATD